MRPRLLNRSQDMVQITSWNIEEQITLLLLLSLLLLLRATDRKVHKAPHSCDVFKGRCHYSACCDPVMLTPSSRVLIDKLAVAQLLKKFPITGSYPESSMPRANPPPPTTTIFL
jgi:hypothetical protein